MKKQSKLYFIVVTLFTMLTVVSASIAVPIVCRPFYYAHIELLDMPEQTPWTATEIRQAYDEMLDFCLFDTPFSTGVLQWSEEGRSHFADCAVLFRLDFVVLLISLLVLLICFILYQKGISPARPLKHGPALWSGSLLLILFLLIGIIGAVNFDAFFVVFHQIFFPGKSNWLFDPATDQIIQVMPEVFFRNCGILIVALIVISCVGLILWDILKSKRKAAKQ